MMQAAYVREVQDIVNGKPASASAQLNLVPHAKDISSLLRCGILQDKLDAVYPCADEIFMRLLLKHLDKKLLLDISGAVKFGMDMFDSEFNRFTFVTMFTNIDTSFAMLNSLLYSDDFKNSEYSESTNYQRLIYTTDSKFRSAVASQGIAMPHSSNLISENADSIKDSEVYVIKTCTEQCLRQKKESIIDLYAYIPKNLLKTGLSAKSLKTL